MAWLLLALTIGAAIALSRLVHGHARGREVAGGVPMPNVHAYDRLSHLLLGSLYRSVAENVAASASSSHKVLEVGCGPGHLSVRLAGHHGLDVTGLDLDPEMIARAEQNAAQSATEAVRQPRFVVGDVAELPFDDASFDIVVSTFSMHHWSDPAAGLGEIARVLRPRGRALIWDFRAGSHAFHGDVPDPATHLHDTPLKLVGVTPWRWPWRITLSQRIELVKDR